MSRGIKDIKKDILDQFRAIEGEENDVIPENWLSEEYLPFLNTFEKKDFEKAVKELAAMGFLKCEMNGSIPKLKLTERGANLIH